MHIKETFSEVLSAGTSLFLMQVAFKEKDTKMVTDATGAHNPTFAQHEV